MSDINIATATNGFVVTEKNLAIGQLSRTWVFTTPQELATFIAAHFEPATKAPENQRGADALKGISGLQRKVIHPISVKVTDQDGSFGFVKWDLEIEKCPAGVSEMIGDELIGVRPGLYRQEVNVPAQYGSWMPASNPIPDDKPESDLSDITASVIKRQGL